MWTPPGNKLMFADPTANISAINSSDVVVNQ